jgi:hypothetical protein
MAPVAQMYGTPQLRLADLQQVAVAAQCQDVQAVNPARTSGPSTIKALDTTQKRKKPNDEQASPRPASAKANSPPGAPSVEVKEHPLGCDARVPDANGSSRTDGATEKVPTPPPTKRSHGQEAAYEILDAAKKRQKKNDERQADHDERMKRLAHKIHLKEELREQQVTMSKYHRRTDIDNSISWRCRRRC